jgi:hypothetical protein
MNVFDSLRNVVARRKQDDQQLFQKDSKERLAKIIRKKLRTSFIGALASFEAHFGRLWGHGLTPAQCTPQQRANREIWESCRRNVLTNGNDQIRALDSEVLQYLVIEWQRYQAVLTPKQENDSEE